MPRRHRESDYEAQSVLEQIEGLDSATTFDAPFSSGIPRREPQGSAVVEPASETSHLLDLSKLSDAELFAVAWRAGYLRHLLELPQREIYDQIKRDLWGHGGYLEPSGDQKLFVLECCRRFGKSFVCAVLAFELCLLKPGARVYWLAETGGQVATILEDVLPPLLLTCPAELEPTIVHSRWRLTFKNGSRVQLRGCDEIRKADRIRGGGADLVIIDEAGSISILDYVFTDIASYMTLRTGGRILMPSTPARTPAHPFTNFCINAETGKRGGFAKRNCFEAQFSPAKLAELEELVGGRDTAGWRRDALVERVIDSDLAIVSEFSQAGAEDDIVQPHCSTCDQHYDDHTSTGHEFRWAVEVPEYRYTYCGIDWGHHPDFTAMVFGSWDFKTTTFIVEGEAELLQSNTTEIADVISSTETRLWGELRKRPGLPDDAREPRRVSDVDPHRLYNLQTLHGIRVQHSDRRDKEAAINNLKVAVHRRQIRIHPSCQRMIAHLKAGLWKPRKGNDGRTFDRVKGFGHFDLIDALVFAHRNVVPNQNPFPSTAQQHHMHGWRKPGQQHQAPDVPDHLKDLAQSWAGSRNNLFRSRGR